MNSLFKLSFAAAATLVAFGAQAGTMVIDDFEQRTIGTATATAGVATTATGAGAAAGSIASYGDRVVSITSVTPPTGGDATDQYTSANVRPYAGDGNGTGQLSISNSAGASSTVNVTWSGLSYGSLPITAYEAFITLTQIDTGTVALQGTSSSTRNVTSANVNTSVSLGQVVGALGNSYSINFTSSENTDSFYDSLTVVYTCQTNVNANNVGGLLNSAGNNSSSDGCTTRVPVPGSLALLGLGLLGLGVSRRRA